MARDRNLFAWQAYVITMSFVVVGLLVALGFSIASSSNTKKSMEDAVNRANEAAKSTRTLTTELQYVKAMLGQSQFTEAEWEGLKKSATDESAKVLQTQYDKDMSLFSASEPIQNRNYPKLVEYLIRELRARNAQVDTAAKTQADLAKKMDSTVKAETVARETAEKKSADLEKNLEEVRADFLKKLDENQNLITQVNETLQKNNKEYAIKKAELESIASASSKKATDLLDLNSRLRERIRVLEGEDFQSAQGKISLVADGGKIVWLNLGKADGLRPGVRFGIVNPDELKLKDAKPKAHVQIVEVLSDHEARGEVVSGSIRIPVLAGDLVYSVAWQKGRKVQFALMGKLDINGDGADDREAVKELIAQNGGEVVEDLNEKGIKTGPGMTVETRWIVVGTGFKPSSNQELDPNQKIFQDLYYKMQERAKELAVSQINLDKLLNWIQSSRGGDRSIPMGTATRGSDFTDQRRVPSSDGAVSEIYTNRRNAGPYTPARPIEGAAR